MSLFLVSPQSKLSSTYTAAILRFSETQPEMCYFFAKTVATTKSFLWVIFRTTQFTPTWLSYIPLHSILTVTGVQPSEITIWQYVCMSYNFSLPCLGLCCSVDYLPIWYIPIYQNSSINFEAHVSAALLSRNPEIFPETQSPISPRAPSVFTVTFDMATLLVSQQTSSLKTLTMDYFYFHCLTIASPQKAFALVEEIVLWYMYFTAILTVY